MPIRFSCHSCHAAYTASDRDAGKESPCKMCGTLVRVPGGAGVASTATAAKSARELRDDVRQRPSRDVGPPPLPRQKGRKGKMPAGVIVALCVLPLLLAGGVVGVVLVVRQAAKHTQAALEEDVVHDVEGMMVEFKANRPGALNKYKGKLIEVEVAGVGITGGDEKGIWLTVLPPDGMRLVKQHGFTMQGWFGFRDTRNDGLKTIQKGAHRGKIRGRLTGVEQMNLFVSDMFYITLNPAWVVEPLEPSR